MILFFYKNIFDGVIYSFSLHTDFSLLNCTINPSSFWWKFNSDRKYVNCVNHGICDSSNYPDVCYFFNLVWGSSEIIRVILFSYLCPLWLSSRLINNIHVVAERSVKVGRSGGRWVALMVSWLVGH